MAETPISGLAIHCSIGTVQGKEKRIPHCKGRTDLGKGQALKMILKLSYLTLCVHLQTAGGEWGPSGLLCIVEVFMRMYCAV